MAINKTDAWFFPVHSIQAFNSGLIQSGTYDYARTRPWRTRYVLHLDVFRSAVYKELLS
jgi:hypothetical protein